MKKIIRTYLITVAASQTTYMLILGFGYINPEPNGDLTFTFTEYLTISVLGLTWTLMSGLITVVLLYALSLLNKSVLNSWFVAGFASSLFILISPMVQNIWLKSILIAISFAIVIFIVRVQKWKVKFQNKS